jgi:hypothetical protein
VLIEPGEGDFDELEETRRRVAVATRRGRDAASGDGSLARSSK